MKAIQFFGLASALMFSITTQAQIKITPGGKSTIGYAGTPASAIRTHIVGNTLFSQSSSGTGAMIRGYNGVSSASKPDYTWYTDSTTGIFHSASNALGFSTNGAERMRINSNGKILMTSSAAATIPEYSWKGDSVTGIYHPATSTIGFSINGSEKVRINSSGQLLINTTSASANEKLRIIAASGDNYAARIEVSHSSDWIPSMVTIANRANSANYMVKYNNDTTRFYVAGSGWIYSAGVYLGSDRNIKDDILTIDSASYKINQIRGVTYKLKEEKQNPQAFDGVAHTYMGVIAQEVEAVAPQVVKTIHNGTKAVCYEMLVGLLIQGMKEQNAKIEQLQNDMANCCVASPGTGGRTMADPNTTDKKGENINTVSTKSWLAQNKPNPFKQETSIEYNVTEEGTASVMVFDMNGKLLKTLPVKIPGKASVSINCSDLQAGMYYYSLVVNGKEIDTKKMILTE